MSLKTKILNILEEEEVLNELNLNTDLYPEPTYQPQKSNPLPEDILNQLRINNNDKIKIGKNGVYLKGEQVATFGIEIIGNVQVDPKQHFDTIEPENRKEYKNSILFYGGFIVYRQGEGIGKKIIKKIFKDNSSIENIFLYALDKQKAVTFWQKLGAKVIFKEEGLNYMQISRSLQENNLFIPRHLKDRFDKLTDIEKQVLNVSEDEEIEIYFANLHKNLIGKIFVGPMENHGLWYIYCKFNIQFGIQKRNIERLCYWNIKNNRWECNSSSLLELKENDLNSNSKELFKPRRIENREEQEKQRLLQQVKDIGIQKFENIYVVKVKKEEGFSLYYLIRAKSKRENEILHQLIASTLFSLKIDKIVSKKPLLQDMEYLTKFLEIYDSGLGQGSYNEFLNQESNIFFLQYIPY